MKTYLIKNIFGPTIQGEGALVGSVVAFVRFSGCNMWDGRAETKAASACPYCDTDFRGGERLTAAQIVERLKALLPYGWVVLSGGEPLLQLDLDLVFALKDAGYILALETNGTLDTPLALHREIGHVTMSPKVPREQIHMFSADEIKVLYPHPNPLITPEHFNDYPADHKFIQPVNDESSINDENMAKALAKVLELGGPWRLSLQIHKILGVE
jgi:7-carboxy-7-deazaguanine synthase